MRANMFALPRPARSLAEAVPRRAARDALRDVAGPAQIDGRLHGAGLRSDPAGRSLRHPRVTGRTASCSSAMHFHRPAPPPEPARARSWSMSSGCATSTSRAGSRPRAWARQRSPPSMTTRSSWPATPFPSKRHLGFGPIRSTPRRHWIALRWAKFFAHWGRGTLRRFAAVPAGSNSGDEAHDETPAWARRTPAHK